MDKFEYRVVPAPIRALRWRGIRGAKSRFAHTIEHVINECSADGWEYLRADTLPMEKRRLLSARETVLQNVLVFRRVKEAVAGTAPGPVAGSMVGLAPDSAHEPASGSALGWAAESAPDTTQVVEGHGAAVDAALLDPRAEADTGPREMVPVAAHDLAEPAMPANTPAKSPTNTRANTQAAPEPPADNDAFRQAIASIALAGAQEAHQQSPRETAQETARDVKAAEPEPESVPKRAPLALDAAPEISAVRATDARPEAPLRLDQGAQTLAPTKATADAGVEATAKAPAEPQVTPAAPMGERPRSQRVNPALAARAARLTANRTAAE